jgi:hypothetical protein
LREEEQYPEKPVINEPEGDIAMGQCARSASIVDIESWENGDGAACTRIFDMLRNGVYPVKRGRGIIRLVEQLSWGNSGLVAYMPLLDKKT